MSDESAMNGDADETLFDKLLSVLNKPVNIKKGQFTSPEEMKFVLEKAYSTSNKNIYLFALHD